jgi:hypothetical protein
VTEPNDARRNELVAAAQRQWIDALTRPTAPRLSSLRQRQGPVAQRGRPRQSRGRPPPDDSTPYRTPDYTPEVPPAPETARPRGELPAGQLPGPGIAGIGMTVGTWTAGAPGATGAPCATETEEAALVSRRPMTKTSTMNMTTPT